MMEFFWSYLWPLIIIVAQSVLLIVILLLAIAYVLYADRKIWAAVQIRRGPNVVGPYGILQSFADLLKFVLKEPVIPVNAGWVIADINVGILYIFAISSLSVYGIIMGGWASNSKYPFLAALATTKRKRAKKPRTSAPRA